MEYSNILKKATAQGDSGLIIDTDTPSITAIMLLRDDERKNGMSEEDLNYFYPIPVLTKAE
jgi:hypothetical protein